MLFSQEMTDAMYTTKTDHIDVASQNSNIPHHDQIYGELLSLDGRASSMKRDKQAALDRIKKPHGTKRWKLIFIHHHFIRQQLLTGMKSVANVPSSKQKVEIMKNALKSIELKRQCELIKMHNMPRES